jgi:DNA-binding NtrC family response regulator
MPTVLVVDDNETLVYFTARNLQRRIDTLQVFTASSCSQARREAAGHPPSIVVVDAGLPDGNGMDLIREFLKLYPGVAAILISGELPPESERDGLFDSLAKPYEVEALIEVVLRALSRQPGPSPESKETNQVRLPDQPATQNFRRHEALNRLASLLTGLKAFGGELRNCSEDPVAVRSTVDEYLDRLCDFVKDVAEIVKEGETRR